MSKLYRDLAAEREANDIGEKFMNSSDVVGDMSRAYGTDLSSVQIHTDGAAAQSAAQRGVDAFSTGRDIFFARGAFDQSDPASRGLLAHELGHSMQQGVGESGGMSQSAPMGAEQGGFLDFFRRLFGIKSEEEEAAEAAAGAEWDQEKQNKLAELDQEDERTEQWKQQLAAENLAAQNNDLKFSPKDEKLDETNSKVVDMEALLEKAKAVGWRKEDTSTTEARVLDREFDRAMMEDFLREASGNGLASEDGQSGGSKERKRRVLTTNKSMEEIMDVLEGNNEESTARFLRPLLDFSVKEFTTTYPLQDKTIQEREAMWPDVNKALNKILYLDQWGQKYGFHHLSKPDQKKFVEQRAKFQAVVNWVQGVCAGGQEASIAQKYEQDIKDLDTRPVYQGDLKDQRRQVLQEMGRGGEVIPYARFAPLAQKLMIAGGDKARKINRLADVIPGFSYDAQSDSVISPIPLADLRGLSRGNRKVLNKYADKLRGMSWQKEDGGVRRAGLYQSDTTNFAADFKSDFAYFKGMNATRYLLEKFGGADFINSQEDSGDLKDRMALAEGTATMMHMRAGTPNAPNSEMYKMQILETGVQPTWIKRHLLETSRVQNQDGPQRIGEYDENRMEVRKDLREFYSTQGKALAQMVDNAQSSPETMELLKDPKLREMAIQSLERGGGDMLAAYNDKTMQEMTDHVLRGNSAGELNVFNTVMKANADALYSDISNEIQGKEVTDQLVDQCLEIICRHVTDTGSPLHEMTLGAMRAYGRSKHFQDLELRSQYVMNNLVLRCVTPHFATINRKFTAKLMAAVNNGESAACQRFRKLLATPQGS
jgi:hypothetical protein